MTFGLSSSLYFSSEKAKFHCSQIRFSNPSLPSS